MHVFPPQSSASSEPPEDAGGRTQTETQSDRGREGRRRGALLVLICRQTGLFSAGTLQKLNIQRKLAVPKASIVSALCLCIFFIRKRNFLNTNTTQFKLYPKPLESGSFLDCSLSQTLRKSQNTAII